MTRRHATLAPQFLDALKMQLPNERYTDGTPSRLDFLQYELQDAIALMAEDWEGHTVPAEHDTRQFIAAGKLVSFYVLHTYLDDDGVVQIYSITM